ncbi:MAG: hypothetical protein ACTSWY_11520 [Promethearchaeota archaeon]
MSKAKYSEEKLEMILNSISKERIKKIIKDYNEKCVKEDRKQDKLKGYSSLRKEDLIKFLKTPISESEKKDIYITVFPEFMKDLLKTAFNLLSGNYARESFTNFRKTPDGIGYTADIRGINWDEVVKVEILKDSVERECGCRIGKADGLCIHQMAIFIKMYKEGSITLKEFPLEVKKKWLGDMTEFSDLLEQLNFTLEQEKKSIIQPGAGLEEIFKVNNIGKLKTSTGDRGNIYKYRFLKCDYRGFNFLIRITEQRYEKSDIFENKLYKIRCTVNNIGNNVIFCGNVRSVTSSKGPKSPKIEISADWVKRKRSKQSKKSIKNDEIRFLNDYSIKINSNNNLVNLEWGGDYPGRKSVDVSQEEDDLETWVTKKVVEKLLSPIKIRKKEGSPRIIVLDEYGVISKIMSRPKLIAKIIKKFQAVDENLPSDEKSLEKFLKENLK